MEAFNDLSWAFGRRPDAVAFIKGSRKYPDIEGRALFYEGRGGVVVSTEVTGLPRGSGRCDKPIFAYHIHSGGECSGNNEDQFANVGSHFNPNNCPHPYHAGDMPPLISADGKAFSVFLTDRFTVNEVLGKTVIIHISPDDFMTEPSGNAGEKIACGVITPTVR